MAVSSDRHWAARKEESTTLDGIVRIDLRRRKSFFFFFGLRAWWALRLLAPPSFFFFFFRGCIPTWASGLLSPSIFGHLFGALEQGKPEGCSGQEG